MKTAIKVFLIMGLVTSFFCVLLGLMMLLLSGTNQTYLTAGIVYLVFGVVHILINTFPLAKLSKAQSKSAMTVWGVVLLIFNTIAGILILVASDRDFNPSANPPYRSYPNGYNPYQNPYNNPYNNNPYQNPYNNNPYNNNPYNNNPYNNPYGAPNPPYNANGVGQTPPPPPYGAPNTPPPPPTYGVPFGNTPAANAAANPMKTQEGDGNASADRAAEVDPTEADPTDPKA